MADRGGALWVATGFASRGGVSRLWQGAWITWTRQHGLAGEIARSLFQDREGRLWFGSEFDGIAVYDGQHWQVFTPKNGLAGWEVKKIVQDEQGVYWLGTDKGLNRLDRFPTGQLAPSKQAKLIRKAFREVNQKQEVHDFSSNRDPHPV
jgi:ligand-binding sensor domain-containing protein